MKIGTLITSCVSDIKAHRDEGIRDTWLNTWGHMVDHKFFVGRNSPDLVPDEIGLDVDDGYGAVPYKTQAQCKWAEEHDYDYVFICDIDTYVVVPELLKSGFEKHDYIGQRCDEGHASGGAGYWLSRKAYTLVAACPPVAGWGDLSVGHILAAAGIPLFNDPRIGQSMTHHMGRGTGNYDPEWMRDWHKRYLEHGHED